VAGSVRRDAAAPGRPALAADATARDAWLMFPEGDPTSVPPSPPPSTIIALDATWPQARRMRQRLAVLRGRRILALAPTPAVERMRKAPLVGHVSTIEAIAAALRLCGEADAADALDRVFELAIERQRSSGRRPHTSG
jgi:DTW domain-containing protein YfiP